LGGHRTWRCAARRNRRADAVAGEKLKPDLVLTDIALAGRNGLELIKDLGALRPELPVLVLSMHEESLYAGRALRAGARGYVMNGRGDRVIQAIGRCCKGALRSARRWRHSCWRSTQDGGRIRGGCRCRT